MKAVFFSSIVLVSTFAFSAGCQSTMYDWGSYETSVLQMYAQQGNGADSQQEAARLTNEIQQTESRDRLVPPGKYAHLGYLCYVNGDHTEARKYFESEKRAFPESGRFMDFMLARLEAQ